MKPQFFHSWVILISAGLLIKIPETYQSTNVHSKGEYHAKYKPTSSRRNIISGFNRENLVDSREEYFIDPASLGNQLSNQDDIQIRSEAAGQQSMFLPGSDVDGSSSPLGEAQLPTIAASDYKIAYSDGLPFPTHKSSNQAALVVYDTPQDPLDQSDSNTVKIADPMANKKLFSSEGFSHGMGELNNAINTLLIDKVLNSDNDKDFNKELKLLSEEFSKDESGETSSDGRKQYHQGRRKQECQPGAKSIFANCKKKRSAVCSPEDHETFYKNALKIHNLFRKIHGVSDLEMNEKLSKDAQEYAEHLAKSASSAHSLRRDRPGQGENIAVGCTSAGSELRSKEAISQWYSKACQKDFDFGGYKKGVEPFAQLVWKSTAFLGMGKAVSSRDGNLCTYIVARYSPEGDKNTFAQNVLKGTFSKGGICSSSCVVKGNVAHPVAPKPSKVPENEKPKEDTSDEFQDNFSSKPDANADKPDMNANKPDKNADTPDINADKPDMNSDRQAEYAGKSSAQAQGQYVDANRADGFVNKVDISTKNPDVNTGKPDTNPNRPKKMTQNDTLRPVQPEIKKVEDKKPDEVSHETMGNTKIRNDDVRQDAKPAAASKMEKPVNAAHAQDHASLEASEVGHGLSKLNDNKMRVITDQDFTTANSQQHSQANVSATQKENMVKEGKEVQQSAEGSIKEGMQITSSEPTPKAPMLINITFPNQLQTKNNSMIQITVGDESPVKTAPSEQLANFKPVARFTGGYSHFENEDEEFLEKGGRNSRLNEGRVNDKSMKWFDGKTEESTPFVGYKMRDFQFGSQVNPSKLDQNNRQKVRNTTTVEPDSTISKNYEAKAKHMFQDRKGMNSKNGDNSVTYIKIANKLMHDKDSTNDVNYFMPKHLENDAASAYSKEKNDYGFTDQSEDGKGRKEKSEGRKEEKLVDGNHGNKPLKNLGGGEGNIGRKANNHMKEDKEESSGNKGMEYGNRNNGLDHNSKNKGVDYDNRNNGLDHSNRNNGFDDNNGNKGMHSNNGNKGVDYDNRNNGVNHNNRNSGVGFNNGNKGMQYSNGNKGGNDDSRSNGMRYNNGKYGEYDGNVSKGKTENKLDESMNYKGNEKSNSRGRAREEYHLNLKGPKNELENYNIRIKQNKSFKGRRKNFAGKANLDENVEKGDDHEFGFTSKVEKLNTDEKSQYKYHNRVLSLQGTSENPSKSMERAGKGDEIDSEFGLRPNVERVRMESKSRKKVNAVLTPFDKEVEIASGFIASGAEHSKYNTNGHAQEHGTAEDSAQINLNGDRHGTDHEKAFRANPYKGDLKMSTSLQQKVTKNDDSVKENENFSEHRKLMKLIGSEISDHKVERKKPFLGQFENRKFLNLEKEILSQQDNLFHKGSAAHYKNFTNSKWKTDTSDVVDTSDGKGSPENRARFDSKASDNDSQRNNFAKGIKENEALQEFATSSNSLQLIDHRKAEEPSGQEERTNGFFHTTGGKQRKGELLKDERKHQNEFREEQHGDNKENVGFQRENQSTFGDKMATPPHLNEASLYNKTDSMEQNSFRTWKENYNATVNSTMNGETSQIQGERLKDKNGSGDGTNREMAGRNGSAATSSYESEGNGKSLQNPLNDTLNSSKDHAGFLPSANKTERLLDVDQSNNSTTINVGTGFIKIKYEKPIAANSEAGRIHATEIDNARDSPGSVVAQFHAKDSKEGDKLESQRNLGFKEGLARNNEASTHSARFEDRERASKYGDHSEKYSKEKSFSPVINRENNHHFIIQIKPTKPLERDREYGNIAQQIRGAENVSISNTEDSEFDDVSKLKSMATKKLIESKKESEMGDNLMEENAEESLKVENVIKPYMKDSENDNKFVGSREPGHGIQSPLSFSRQDQGNETKESMKTAHRQPKENSYDKQEEFQISSSRKFAPDHNFAKESSSLKENVQDRKTAQDFGESKSYASERTSSHNDTRTGEKIISTDAVRQNGGVDHSEVMHGSKEFYNNSKADEKIEPVGNFSSIEGKQIYSKPPHSIDNLEPSSGTRLYAKYESSDIIPNDNQDEELGTYDSNAKNPETHQGKKGQENVDSKSDDAKNAANETAEDKSKDESQTAKLTPGSAQITNEKNLFYSIEKILHQDEARNDVNAQGHSSQFSTDDKVSHGYKAGSLDTSNKDEEAGKGDGDIICKSNCEKPSSKEFYHEGSESNIVGLNLHTGFDQFSGFDKFKGRGLDEVRGDKFAENHAVAAAKFMKDDSSSNNKESGKELIFIPERAILGFQRDMTKEHNRYRKLHDAPYLYLDSKLSRDSQGYAKELARTGSIQHSSLKNRPETGESIEKLCVRSGGMPTPKEVLKKWYSEVCDPGYIFTRDGKQPGTGHFTQVVWKSTKALGVGLAASKGPDGQICSYVVARYFKAGNDLTTIRSNVVKGKFKSCNKGGDGVEQVRNKPTQSNRGMEHTTSLLARQHQDSKGTSSRDSYHGNRKHWNFAAKQTEFSTVKTTKDGEYYFDGNLPHESGDHENAEKENGEFYNAGANNIAKGTSTGVVRNAPNSHLSREHGTYVKNSHPNANSHPRWNKSNGEHDFHFSVQYYKPEDSTTFSSGESRDEGFASTHAAGSAQGSKLLETPRYDDFSLNNDGKTRASSKSGYHHGDENENEFEVTNLMKQKGIGDTNYHQKSPNQDESHYDERSHGYKQNAISSQKYWYGKAGKDAYASSERSNKDFESNRNMLQHGAKQQIRAEKNMAHFNKAAESSEFLVPGDVVYHSKGNLPSSQRYTKERATQLNHEDSKTMDGHLGVRPKFSDRGDKNILMDSEPHKATEENIEPISYHHQKQKLGTAHAKAAEWNDNEARIHSKKVESQKLKNFGTAHQNKEVLDSLHADGAQKIHSKELTEGNMHQRMQSHPKARVHTTSLGSMEGDPGYMEGLNAAFGLGNGASARNMYDEPVGKIGGTDEDFGGIGNIPDSSDATTNAPVPQSNENDIGSLRDEGNKLEEEITNGDSKDPDQSFEESLMKSVRLGTADVAIEKSVDEYKTPSVLMDEYHYESPENGQGENIYENFFEQGGEGLRKSSVNGNHGIAGTGASRNKELLMKGHRNSTGVEMSIHNTVKGSGIKSDGLDSSGSSKHESSNDNTMNTPGTKFQSGKQEDVGHISGNGEKVVVAGGKENGKNTNELDMNIAVTGQHGIQDGTVESENKHLKSGSFNSGFEDALSALSGFDGGKLMDETAARKEELMKAPTQEEDEEGMLKNNGHSLQNNGTKLAGEVPDVDKGAYDTSRSRHFIIDKNSNLVLRPGEETGSIADYEAKHLADLTRQATYGISSVAKMFKGTDITGLNSLQKVIPDQKDYQSGVIAWSGPYNPGLPSEDEVKQGDLSGQNLVENLERPLAFKTEPLRRAESTEHLTNGNAVHNSSFMTSGKGKSIVNTTRVPDIVSKFHHELKNASDLDDSLPSGFDKSNNEFFTFHGKIFHDDKKLLPEKNLDGVQNSARTTKHEDMGTFRQNALMWHNKIRCVHYADRLRLNDSLSKEADDYANEIATKRNGILDHSKLETRPGEGEILAMACSAQRNPLSGAKVTFKWYNDICEKGYDFKSNEIQKGTGHFTQLVWEKTTDFGIGRAMLKKNGRFCSVVVARYYPKGNVPKEFLDNVKQGAYNDQTCENLEKELTRKTGADDECNLKQDGKKLGKFIEEDIGNALGSFEKMAMHKPLNATKEREKARLNHEIRKVTEIISKLEKENSDIKQEQGLQEQVPNTGAFSESEKAKEEQANDEGMTAKGEASNELAYVAGKGGEKQTFSDLGGTGSPVIVYHGVTGHFEDPKTFTNIGVETHNKLRKIHKAPAVKLDVSLAMEAFKYATYLTQLGFLKHDEKLPKNQGENLAIGCFDNNSEMSSEDAVSRWYYEVCQPGYNFKSNIAASGTGHFSQVVWKSTKKIGIAKQTRMHGNMKCTYIVARYSPAGNVHDEYDKNVEKGNFDDSVCKELMQDLMRFQERNEKLIPQLESGLKQAQTEAKVQEKIMAMMQLKAMEKQKQKQKQKQKEQKQAQGEKPKDINQGLKGEQSKATKQNSKGGKPEDIEQGLKSVQSKVTMHSSKGGRPKDIKQMAKFKGIMDGMHVAGSGMHMADASKKFTKANLVKNSPFWKTDSTQGSPKNKPKILTGVLNNGLKTIVEDNHRVMHIGPTVKIIENANGGGLMYRKVEGPSVARQLGSGNRPSQAGNGNGHANSYMMRKGKMSKKIMTVESGEFTDPMSLIRTHDAKLRNPLKPAFVMTVNRQSHSQEKPATIREVKNSARLSSATFDPMSGKIVEVDSSHHRNSGVDARLIKNNQKNRKQVTKNFSAKISNRNNAEFFLPNHAVASKMPARLNYMHSKSKMDISKSAAPKMLTPLKSPIVTKKVPYKSWSPAKKKPLLITHPPKMTQQRPMPASLIRILHGKTAVQPMPQPKPHPQISKMPVQHHKLPDSLLRMLEGKPMRTTIRQSTPKIALHPTGHQEQHKLPDSLLRMLHSKSNPALFKPAIVNTVTTSRPGATERSKAAENLQRMTQTKKVASSPTPKFLTEKPYSIKLDGREVPYSLFKMLAAEAASGRNPKVSNYLMKTPFKIVQSHHNMPESLKRILFGKSQMGNSNLRKNSGGNSGGQVTMFEGLNTDKSISTQSKEKGQNFDKTMDAGSNGMQSFQQQRQLESFSNTASKEIPEMSAMTFSSPEGQQGKSLGLPNYPTPVMGIARTTVALRYPETTTTTSVLEAAKNAGIKGPSLANIVPGTGLKHQMPIIPKVLDSPTQKSFNAYTTKSAGVLLSIDTQKNREEFERSSLETHNLYRRVHRVSPLKLDYKMSIDAENYARKIAQSGRLDHSGTEDGENIASVCRKGKSLMTGMEAADIWYKEVCDPGYDFKSEQPGWSGHFTQVVWKSTTQLGVGRAEAMHNGLLCTYVVARYRPAGNFIGEFSKNVFTGGFDGTQCSDKVKKSRIEKAGKVKDIAVPKSVKRSRIPPKRQAKSSRKTLVDFNGDSRGEESYHAIPIDDVIAQKANSAWLPDIEAGIQGSDLAGMIPLRVEAGEGSRLMKYANATMDELTESEQKLAKNFASKLREDVMKVIGTKKAARMSQAGLFGNSKDEIDAASIQFQNMEDSFKKSEPTLPPQANAESNSDQKTEAKPKPSAVQSGDARSGENPLTPDMASKVNQAVQQLQSAAQSVSNAVSPVIANSAANSAMEGIQASNNNAAMAKFAANMISASKGDSNQANGAGQTSAQLNQASNTPVAEASSPQANGLSTSGAQDGSLAASNMVAANQEALSKAAEDKKAASAGYKPTEFEQSALNAHNKYRTVHDAPPLVLNQDLSKDAEAWAEQCAAMGMPRRSQSPFGENVVESCKPGKQEMTATEATETWYSELCNPGYDFDAAEITGSERFTQVVWKGTTEMGIGKASRVKADLLCTYIVARYSPPGNVLGDVKGSVLRGRLDSKHFCQQFLAAAKMAGKNRILDNLPVKSERLEEAGSVGSTLHAGIGQPEDEIVAGGDDPAADGASSNKKDFRQEALYNHNRFRAVHNAPPLQLDVKKCQEAEEMAANLAAKGSLMRSKDNLNGQNIAMSCNKDGIEMSGDEATNKWYNEICNPGYDFKGPYSFGAAHFMQVVWASSKKFGIGKATTTLDNMLCTWVVALYEPSGVMRNMAKENVLFGLFDYRYCDTFGKGGGGKGGSSGVIHNNVDSKISAPNAAGQSVGKRNSLIAISDDESTEGSIIALSKRNEQRKRTRNMGDERKIKRRDENNGKEGIQLQAKGSDGSHFKQKQHKNSKALYTKWRKSHHKKHVSHHRNRHYQKHHHKRRHHHHHGLRQRHHTRTRNTANYR